HERKPSLGGSDLAFEALDFAGKTRAGPLEDGDPLIKEGAAVLEDGNLSCNRRGERLVTQHLLAKVGRDHHLVESVPLGLEPGLRRPRLEILSEDLLELGGAKRALKSDENLPGLHRVALADEDRLDDSAFEMLDRTHVAGDADDSRSDDGTLERRHQRPCGKAAAEEQDDREAKKGQAGTEGRSHRRIGSRIVLSRTGHQSGLFPGGTGTPSGSIMRLRLRQNALLTFGMHDGNAEGCRLGGCSRPRKAAAGIAERVGRSEGIVAHVTLLSVRPLLRAGFSPSV